jgi:hypothetical protein
VVVQDVLDLLTVAQCPLGPSPGSAIASRAGAAAVRERLVRRVPDRPQQGRRPPTGVNKIKRSCTIQLASVAAGAGFATTPRDYLGHRQHVLRRFDRPGGDALLSPDVVVN